MKIVNRVNHMLKPVSFLLNRRVFARKVAGEKRACPHLFKPVSKETIAKHTALWRPIIGKVNCNWLEHYCTMSGREDYRFVPEDVFFVVLERVLNDCAYRGSDVENKNRCCFYVPKIYQPQAIVRYDRGSWFDHDFNPIDRAVAAELLSKYEYKVVGKPASDSCGGDNVRCFARGSDVSPIRIEQSFSSYVVQECLIQEPGMASFNPSSLNTCRLMTFRRPWSGKTSVVGSMCRFGCGDGIVDNLAAGGVCVDISSDGVLDDKGIGHGLGCVANHPKSNKKFADFKVPYFKEMCETCCGVAKKIPGYHTLSFDVIVRPDGTPCIVEINAKTQGVEQLQMRRPLFGDETEQVRDWVLEHLAFAEMNNLVFS